MIAPCGPLSPPVATHFPVVGSFVYPPFEITGGSTVSVWLGFGVSVTSDFCTGADGPSTTTFPLSGKLGFGSSTFGGVSGKSRSGTLLVTFPLLGVSPSLIFGMIGPSTASESACFLLPFLEGSALTVPENVPPPFTTSLSIVTPLFISVLIPSRLGPLSLLSLLLVFPLTVTSPPTVMLSLLIPIVPFAVCSLSITSPTSPRIPPPLVPPLAPTIAPPPFKSECTSSTLIFPPTFRLPSPVSEPITPPFRLTSFPTFTSILFLAVIPACWEIESPFL